MPIMAIMDMAWPIMGTVMVWLIMVTMVHMPILMVLMDTTMARGLLMPSPLPRPMPFMVPMVTMVWATTVWVTEPTDTATLTLTIMDTGVTSATRTPIVPTDTSDTESKSLSYCYFVQELRVRYVKWVAPSHTNCY